MVSLISFCVMLLALELESCFLLGSFLLPSISWLIILLIVSPAISLIAVTLIVRGSAKAQSVEESQQSAVFLVIPVILFSSRTVHRGLTVKCVDFAGAWCSMCAACLVTPQKVYGTVHLRNTDEVGIENPVLLCSNHSLYDSDIFS